MTSASPVYQKHVVLFASKKSDNTVFLYITTAQNVARTKDAHNRTSENKVQPSSDSTTKTGAPNWDVMAIIGPVTDGSTKIADKWRESLPKANQLVSTSVLKSCLTKGADIAHQFDAHYTIKEVF